MQFLRHMQMNSLVHSHIEIYFGPGIICLFKAQHTITDSEKYFSFSLNVILFLFLHSILYIYSTQP